ncbi:Lrp/AsnC family transcriptional regulator [Vibrio natriegens]|jgi:DNA-binding Lrp family transcriptional regulator|uniref:AsnC family transcriptional regulator n=1 Tax=Vibrio natriegens NBRC 15636 = ATCC 14048 = DSM 759 TaxID=1219067 RepID=A0AAN0Y6A9_VIBNA|nr:Lrp/AsnC family transcriptional regulator [Vibrio natriegens]ALR18808.1 AsnC family transcriptional regulator [Vibrio natriegens NBRC 15636 = ATCC 14048 = DSM 759]ANQ14776.1 AsnC family transcriptional regulator [Vibrio natriegens NBRC 15636 = ATCC 14048 = DSM 759]EPM39822.1 AsnC family transcriptional regulator [Vibrio natriegens NBRC 15636 = ATCC 14048 = DSM 759]MDX6029910.1 Lrp/AsnC family transcriptional regulator [Vibrio natriegens NBRC 15636 = ATCC 14048 = DSM 759]UUI13411.1 Lrp/AsnC 
MANDLDDYDVKILQLLQDNGRLTNQELSELVGLSASQCSRRRITLENNSLILGYHARLSPKALKQEVIAMIEVKLLNHEAEKTHNFLNFIDNESRIVEVFKTTGDADYLIKCLVADLNTLNDLINRIFTTQLISHIKTSVVLERVKEYGTTLQS